jgi:fermentation-respiration switch protein FrsA (DUF1100 family)
VQSVARVAAVLAAAYVAICVLLFLARDKLIFPAARGATPEPSRLGLGDGEKVTLATDDGEQLVGWYLPPADTAPRPAPALLWLHGNAESVAGIAPLIREFRSKGAALLVVDYRGYGESSGRATARGVIRDAEAMWSYLAARPEVDARRIVVYGRSVGAGPAVHLAANRPAAGLVLESAFTSLRDLARMYYPIFPAFLAGSEFDNLAAMARVRCPVLVIHGERDVTIPPGMGRALAERARGEWWLIEGADHNTTYDVGDEAYVRKVHEFLERAAPQPS